MNPNDNRTRKLSFLGFNTKATGNEDPDLVLLDNEMDKVFAGSSPLTSKKFDITTLSDTNEPKSSLKQTRKISQNEEDSDVDESTALNASAPAAIPSINVKAAKNYDDIPEDSPLVSERAALEDDSDGSFEEKKVQFTSGKKQPTGQSDADERKRRRSRHQYYRQRKYSHQDSQDNDSRERRISVQPEDSTLEEADLNELTSHRSDDPRGLRRHKVHHPSLKLRELPPINMLSIAQQSPPIKKFDHSPHEVFVQLDELVGFGEDREWKETARWIKYEEDVEEGSDRWGKPHVASLSFHSLLNLRRCLETGVVLLDLEEKDLPAVAYRVVEQMVMDDLITPEDKPTVMRALLLKHRHVNEHGHGRFPFTNKKYNSYSSLQNISDDQRKPKLSQAEIANRKYSEYSCKIDINNKEDYSSSQEDIKRLLPADSILKRIPVGAEATTVLVGNVDFLQQPTIAFVRLAEAIPMATITEVPIPVRFMFILLGPRILDLDYHEVGRSISTLMSTEHFHDIAYKAEDRKDLLSAINEFLDDSIVLPPGNWDRHDLLPFDELKAKKDWIRSRKTKAILEKQRKSQVQPPELDTTKLIPEIIVKEQKLKEKGFDDPKKPPNPLEKTHRLWGGLRNDLKRRLPMYKSDIFDGFNSETLAATIFMYFACLSTAITFGGLASDKTHNMIGISETLLSCSIVGVIFHTISGQPLVIIGTTGPLLLFDEALIQFCRQNDLNFLTLRAYVGIWLFVIALIVSAFEGSVYVRLLTRFTQEIFSALITLIYIVETFTKLISVYKRNPLLANYYETISVQVYNETGNDTDIRFVNETLPQEDSYGGINRPNTALFCTILTLGTFAIAYALKLFRNSHFFGRNARRALGDFGVPIAIAIFVAVDFIIPQVYTDKLSVPEGVSPSDPENRGWFIPLDGVPTYLPFAAGIPALLVYILIFMETHISELIVDKPERGLKKGSGLHFDIVLLCLLNMGCGMFGMPWHCAATVRSVAHVSALTIMSRTHAPGESPHIIDVKEQRLSGFFVSLMIGLSVLMAPLLRLIPMAVLFGVFLYMGVASMIGVQFFDRIRLYFMPIKHYPPTPYVKRVPTWKIHMFTTAQVIGLVVLWTVKSSSFSLAFPFFLIMMVPLRFKMGKFYTPTEINALDGTETKSQGDEDADFYEQAGVPA